MDAFTEGHYDTQSLDSLKEVARNYAFIQDLLSGREAPSNGARILLNPSNAHIACSDKPYKEATLVRQIDPQREAVTTTLGMSKHTVG